MDEYNTSLREKESSLQGQAGKTRVRQGDWVKPQEGYDRFQQVDKKYNSSRQMVEYFTRTCVSALY